ncbi:MAG: hypothetical protein COU08_00215 [Candidatus Harrisonbacteria bacterium CG10_big_fil_rev_8_21_14_0_10_42_17]|uniref:HAD family hydrolase n=1 Tax=Candidatus Harrisonbacteria bacterium CG10_big_fil_rev_8_21_14_0_10_42_17 TaxID=1974584 RepID=A0A2M6WJ77_9BACT|nr:MAG: hypothetical protein COU08_00215 [Candidatus Harrisonbacteria bacterium CG10_big_fil_rev_8_21_14_0_10_42_17]
MNNLKTIIFDYGRVLFDRENDQFFPETETVLKHLVNKYTLTIASLAKNDSPKAREQQLENAGLKKYFTIIKFTATNKDELYEKTFEELNLKPEETLIVDDRTIRGIKWGNKKGCKTIWVKCGKFENDPIDEETGTPNHIIKNIGGLTSLI